MKTYEVTIYMRSNACVSPNKIAFKLLFEAKTAKSAKIGAWYYFNTWFNTAQYSRRDFRIEVKPYTAE